MLSSRALRLSVAGLMLVVAGFAGGWLATGRQAPPSRGDGIATTGQALLAEPDKFAGKRVTLRGVRLGDTLMACAS